MLGIDCTQEQSYMWYHLHSPIYIVWCSIKHGDSFITFTFYLSIC
jgi:hypothetical protein